MQLPEDQASLSGVGVSYAPDDRGAAVSMHGTREKKERREPGAAAAESDSPLLRGEGHSEHRE